MRREGTRRHTLVHLTYLWWGKNPRGHWVRGHDRIAGIVRIDASRALQTQLREQRIRLCFWLRVPSWAEPYFSNEARQTQAIAAVRANDITRLSQQLATLLVAGLPLLQALRLMRQGLPPHQGSSVLLQRLAAHIEAGQALSDAMRRYPVFDATFCHLVAAGEASGQLDLILTRLAAHRDKSEALRRRVRSALVYPSIVVGMGLAVSALLLGCVVPTFEQLFQSMGAELPWLTRGVLQGSRLLTEHGAWLLAVLTATVWGLQRWFMHTTPGREGWDWLRLHMPLWRALTRHAQCARWCRTLSTLLGAGLPIHEAMQQLAHVMDHGSYQRATQRIERHILHGHALSQGMAHHPALFDPVLVQMCAVGEESGTLDAMLARMAEHHEQTVDTLTTRLSTLLEPAIMLVLGVTMGTLVLALYWPLFEIGQAL
jgi:type IV pilus assembly protein PilC